MEDNQPKTGPSPMSDVTPPAGGGSPGPRPVSIDGMVSSGDAGSRPASNTNLNPIDVAVPSPVAPSDPNADHSAPLATDTAAPATAAAAPAAAAVPHTQHHSSNKPILIAIVALLIAAALAVVAFFAFRQDTKLPTANKTPETSQQTAQTPAVSQQDTTELSEAIDQQASSLNDTQDYSGTDITDQALGLQ